MLVKHRDYILEDMTHHKVHVAVVPTGIVNLELDDHTERYQAEFDLLAFMRNEDTTWLVCKSKLDNGVEKWKLPLKEKDASDLEHLIEDAEQELNTLFDDLI
ncbi:hypothetical protein MHO82_01555 [Vibrio sp. Of7-15]|uniref:hypothetical protein n=1 Tax=Vibrio sp. Of7-15 TaxID=2724879 RepID=UPI001EF20722|nr:hypothetical protein [Vibrio sp. Of7-15]MCG7495547.1 hypothetical protein [Vibrio sp. Of7-15]